MELRAEYLQKRNCLVGTDKTELNPAAKDKVNYKINRYTEKINEINDALILEKDDE